MADQCGIIAAIHLSHQFTQATDKVMQLVCTSLDLPMLYSWLTKSQQRKLNSRRCVLHKEHMYCIMAP
eukprot:6193884-Pleurochrysis_carterae.AAC.4